MNIYQDFLEVMAMQKATEKRNGDKYTAKALFGALLALALGICIFLLANAVAPFREFGPRAEADDIMPYVFTAQAVLSLVMLQLSLLLLFIYLRDYMHLKSRFTLGLILAIFSFLLFSIAANPLLHMLLGVFGGRGLFPLIPYLFATVSLAILGWLSSK